MAAARTRDREREKMRSGGRCGRSPAAHCRWIILTATKREAQLNKTKPVRVWFRGCCSSRLPVSEGWGYHLLSLPLRGNNSSVAPLTSPLFSRKAKILSVTETLHWSRRQALRTVGFLASETPRLLPLEVPPASNIRGILSKERTLMKNCFMKPKFGRVCTFQFVRARDHKC